MSKKPSQLSRTLPMKSRQDKLISYMLEQSHEEEEHKKIIQELKDRDASNRLQISRLTAQNNKLKEEMHECRQQLKRQDNLMKADRMYIQTLDKEVRRLREMQRVSDKENVKEMEDYFTASTDDRNYGKENEQLLKEVERLMFKYILKTQGGIQQLAQRTV